MAGSAQAHPWLCGGCLQLPETLRLSHPSQNPVTLTGTHRSRLGRQEVRVSRDLEAGVQAGAHDARSRAGPLGVRVRHRWDGWLGSPRMGWGDTYAGVEGCGLGAHGQGLTSCTRPAAQELRLGPCSRTLGTPGCRGRPRCGGVVQPRWAAETHLSLGFLPLAPPSTLHPYVIL